MLALRVSVAKRIGTRRERTEPDYQKYAVLLIKVKDTIKRIYKT